MDDERRTKKRRTADKLRREAEALLKKKPSAEKPVSDHDQLALLHELQVHKIELELQNAELSRAYLEAQELQEKYLDLYDFAPVGYFTLSTKGEIRELNLHAASMLKSERDVLIGRHLRDFISPESLQSFNDFLDEASKAKHEVSATLLTLRRSENDILFVEARGRAFESDFAQPQKEIRIRVVMMDVSELKFATDELQYSFQKFFKYWKP
jgi:PAS domain-containing protein